MIAAGGHEVEWVGDWSVDPGDEQILAHAAADRSVLVTIDNDFGERAVVRGRPPPNGAFQVALPGPSYRSILTFFSLYPAGGANIDPFMAPLSTLCTSVVAESIVDCLGGAAGLSPDLFASSAAF